MPNLLRVIAPYWYEGTWVFDDESVGLLREPFVEGVPRMIDELVAEIADAKRGFRLTFSDQPFPSAQVELTWVREDCGGNWYRSSLSQQEGWLCPALFEYFDRAPNRIYAKAEPTDQDWG